MTTAGTTPQLPEPRSNARGPRAALRRAWPALVLVTVLSAPWLSSDMFLDDWHLLWKASQADWTWDGLTTSFTFLDPESIGTWNLPAAPAYRYFRPLVVAAYKAEMALWGLLPFGFHAVNLLLHLMSVVLVGAIAAHVARSDRVGRLAALLFAVQPHNVAAIVWTAGRTEALAAPLVLGAFLLYLAARRGGKGPDRLSVRARTGLLLGALGAMGTACLVKENAVLVAAFVAAYELVWSLARPGGSWRGRLLSRVRGALPLAVPVFGLALAFVAFRFLAFDSVGTLGEPYLRPVTSEGFAGFAFAKMSYYLGALVTTAPIVPLFGTEFLLETPAALAAAVAVAGVFFWGIVRLAGRSSGAPAESGESRDGVRVAFFGALWMAAGFLPTLPILASDLYPYLPGVGFALIVAAGLARPTRGRRIAVGVLLVVYAVSFSGRGLLYHVQGVAARQAAADIERDFGGTVPDGARLLLVNLPVSVSHVASELRLRSGNADIQAVLLTLSPEWSTPTASGPVECGGPAHMRLGPPPGHDELFASPEEWSMHLFRTPLEAGRTYGTPFGFAATPSWDGDRVTALDVALDGASLAGPLRAYAFFQDGGPGADGPVAHRVCDELGAAPAAPRQTDRDQED